MKMRISNARVVSSVVAAWAFNLKFPKKIKISPRASSFTPSHLTCKHWGTPAAQDYSSSHRGETEVFIESWSDH